MIFRIWRATATPEGADAYREHFAHAVLPVLQGIEGYRGAYLLGRDYEGDVDLQVITVWESLDAIRAFAGRDVERAVVEPAAQAVLIRYETVVTHYDVVIDTATT